MKDLRIYYLERQSLVFFVKIKEICIAFVHVAKKTKKKTMLLHYCLKSTKNTESKNPRT